MSEYLIRPGVRGDAPLLTALSLALWPDNQEEELLQEVKKQVVSTDYAYFIAFYGQEPVGFVFLSLRRDYVEGSTSSPVGYVEGVYVNPAHRRKGLARNLLSVGEKWAKSRGCQELASDIELDNQSSYAMHLAAGFREANRIICLIKQL